MSSSKYNSTPTLEEKFNDLVSRVKTLETAPRLTASSIGEGGMVVKNGGNITVEAGGNINVLGGGAISSYTVDGLGYTILEDGYLRFRYNDVEYPGRIRAGAGLEGRTALWMYPPTSTGEDPTRFILEGPSADWAGSVALRSGGQVVIAAGDGEGSMYMQAPAGDIYLQPKADGYVIIGHGTTSNAANTHLFTNGVIQRSTSSIKYKRDIELAELSVEDVLKLTPKTWRDKKQVEENPETTQRYIGFIAEDLHEAGLGCFVVYEGDEPDAIAYDRLAAGLIVVIKSQQERIKTLEETVYGQPDSNGESA